MAEYSKRVGDPNAIKSEKKRIALTSWNNTGSSVGIGAAGLGCSVTIISSC